MGYPVEDAGMNRECPAVSVALAIGFALPAAVYPDHTEGLFFLHPKKRRERPQKWPAEI